MPSPSVRSLASAAPTAAACAFEGDLGDGGMGAGRSPGGTDAMSSRPERLQKQLYCTACRPLPRPPAPPPRRRRRRMTGRLSGARVVLTWSPSMARVRAQTLPPDAHAERVGFLRSQRHRAGCTCVRGERAVRLSTPAPRHNPQPATGSLQRQGRPRGLPRGLGAGRRTAQAIHRGRTIGGREP